MKLKQGFVKKDWMGMVAVLIAIVASIIERSIPIIAITVLIGLILIKRYRDYDAEVQEADDWWNALSKEEKLKRKNQQL